MADRCSACQTEIRRRYGYCWPCEQVYLKARQRRCAGCRALMPSGHTRKRCGACHTRYMRRLAQRPDRLCSCGSRVPRGYVQKKCPDCRSMESQEYENRKRGRR